VDVHPQRVLLADDAHLAGVLAEDVVHRLVEAAAERTLEVDELDDGGDPGLLEALDGLGGKVRA
jgi:hypothetical protein